MAAKVFLAASALLWLPYGIFCFAQPAFLAESAGVSAGSVTGTIELRAMYGGLQAALGLLAAIAFFRAEWVRPALIALAFLGGGLLLGRLGGVALGSELSTYTTMGLGFEVFTAVVATWLLTRTPVEVAA